MNRLGQRSVVTVLVALAAGAPVQAQTREFDVLRPLTGGGGERGISIDTGEGTHEAERVELIRPHFTNYEYTPRVVTVRLFSTDDASGC